MPKACIRRGARSFLRLMDQAHPQAWKARRYRVRDGDRVIGAAVVHENEREAHIRLFRKRSQGWPNAVRFVVHGNDDKEVVSVATRGHSWAHRFIMTTPMLMPLAIPTHRT